MIWTPTSILNTNFKQTDPAVRKILVQTRLPRLDFLSGPLYWTSNPCSAAFSQMSDEYLLLSLSLTNAFNSLCSPASPVVFSSLVNSNSILLGTGAQIPGAIMGFYFSITFQNNPSERPSNIHRSFKTYTDPPPWSKLPLLGGSGTKLVAVVPQLLSLPTANIKSFLSGPHCLPSMQESLFHSKPSSTSHRTQKQKTLQIACRRCNAICPLPLQSATSTVPYVHACLSSQSPCCSWNNEPGLLPFMPLSMLVSLPRILVLQDSRSWLPYFFMSLLKQHLEKEMATHSRILA